MRSRVIAWTMLAVFLGDCAFAQQSAGTAPHESHKNRTIFTLVGLGGGFAGGLFIGIAAFDDARYSDSKAPSRQFSAPPAAAWGVTSSDGLWTKDTTTRRQ